MYTHSPSISVMTASSTTRAVTINLRARKLQRELIDRAAESLGKSRTDFMLDAACDRASQVLLDQSSFVLDQRRFASFMELLERPVATDGALARLLATAAPWEK